MNSSLADAKNKRYSSVKTQLVLLDLVLTFIFLVAFQMFLSKGAEEIAMRASSFFYVACLVYTFIFMAFMYVVSLPVSIVSAFLVERHFGLTERTFGSWLVDESKSVALSLALYSVCALVFYFVLRNFPGSWWGITAVLWILFTIVMARLLPVLLIPLFYKYLPLEDPSLKDDILALSEKSGVELVDVSQIDLSKKTKKANAALVGMGSTRRVVLADTLVDGFTREEILSVVAHEFGHHKKKHILKLLVWSSIMTAASFYILFVLAAKIAVFLGASSISELFLMPSYIILFSIFGLTILPFQNFFSRVLEREADDFALAVTENVPAFISVMNRLAEKNLSDTHPGTLKKIFLYSHPPISERVERAEKWDAKRTA